MRIDGRGSIEELLYSRCRGRDPEEWADLEHRREQTAEWRRRHSEGDISCNV